MNSPAEGRWEFNIDGQVIKFRLSFRALYHFEQQTGIPYSMLGESLSKLDNVVVMCHGAALAAGEKVSKEEVIDFIDKIGIDKVYEIITKAMQDLEKLKNELDGDESEKKK